jgi:hypothetical protein
MDFKQGIFRLLYRFSFLGDIEDLSVIQNQMSSMGLKIFIFNWKSGGNHAFFKDDSHILFEGLHAHEVEIAERKEVGHKEIEALGMVRVQMGEQQGNTVGILFGKELSRQSIT